MTRTVLTASVVAAATATSASAIFTDGVVTFDEITNWAGTGANESALIIEWADSLDPIVWGYRYDGAATTQDMFVAILEADANLYTTINFAGSFGTAVYGIGYDRDTDGFGITDGSSFDPNGVFETVASADFIPGTFNIVPGTSNIDGINATDADDSYDAGWYTDGFWAFFTYEFNGWNSSFVGLSGNGLADGDLNGLRFAPGFASTAPSVVPAPGAAGLLAFAGIAAARRRRA